MLIDIIADMRKVLTHRLKNVIEENLNSQFYLDTLSTLIYPHIITNILKQDDDMDENEVVYKQDGTLPHYTDAISC